MLLHSFIFVHQVGPQMKAEGHKASAGAPDEKNNGTERTLLQGLSSQPCLINKAIHFSMVAL